MKLKTLSFLAALLLNAATAQAITELKIATIAPQGSSAYNAMKTGADQIATQTAGRVTVKIFAGGVQGDEKDVVRKMRYGQLSGAALTASGLGIIDTSVRVLELPLLFKSSDQVDRVYTGMRPTFDRIFDQKGFVLMGWTDLGFVKIFTNKSVTKLSDLQGMKMWMWEGDPLAESMYKAMGVTPVPLAITDVLTSLQTNLINAVYNTEMGAVAMQWHTKVNHMTDINLVNGAGALVLTKAEWQKISPADQVIVKRIFDQISTQITQQNRAENVNSKTILQNNGIAIVAPDPAALTEFESIGMKVRTDLVGKLYSQDILNQVQALLQ